MSTTSVSKEVPAALERYDSPTITNVINMIAGRSRCAGYVNGSVQPLFADLPPVVGHAVTATFRSAHPGEKVDRPTTFLDMIKMIDGLPGPHIVVLQDLDEPVKAAAFGELMASSYQLFDCRGLLTNGAYRERNRLAKLNFHCWAGPAIASHGYGHLCELNVPVTIGGLDIKPGDLLHGDGSGVVQVPADLAAELPGFCQQWMDTEQMPLEFAAGGNVNLEAYIAMTRQYKAAFAEMDERASHVLPAERRLI